MRRTAAAFALSLLVLGLFVYALGPERVAANLAGADVGVFAVGLLAVLVAVACWSEAQRHLLVAAGVHLRPGWAFVTYCSGMFAKQVLPMGHAGGPAIMAYAIGSESRREYQHVLAAVGVAEVLNVVASFGLAFLGLTYVAAFLPGAPAPRSVQVAVLLGAVLLGGLAATVWYRRGAVERAVAGVAFLLRATAGRVSLRVRRKADRAAVAAGVDRYYATFAKVRADRRRVAVAGGFTLAGWVAFAVPLYVSFLALGHEVSLALALFAVPVGGIASAFPLPGGLGGIEVTLVALLAAVTGLAVAELAAVVILYRLASYWFMVLVGGLGSVYRVLVGAPVPTEAAP